jgi:hypothetical protein
MPAPAAAVPPQTHAAAVPRQTLAAPGPIALLARPEPPSQPPPPPAALPPPQPLQLERTSPGVHREWTSLAVHRARIPPNGGAAAWRVFAFAFLVCMVTVGFQSAQALL